MREDRIILACKIHTGEVKSLHVTNRLAKAIVVALKQRVEKKSQGAIYNDFLQQEAVSNKSQAEAIKEPSHSKPWLLTHMHLQDIDQGTRVIFSHEEEFGVHLEGEDRLLRNILDIFHKAFGLAEWSKAVFPAWASPAPQQGDAVTFVN
jgi:hypothetical protein